MNKGNTDGRPMKVEDNLTELKTRGEAALIAYNCAGDPMPEGTAATIPALVRGGADIIELERVFDADMNYELFFDLARSLDVDLVARMGGYR